MRRMWEEYRLFFAYCAGGLLAYGPILWALTQGFGIHRGLVPLDVLNAAVMAVFWPISLPCVVLGVMLWWLRG